MLATPGSKIRLQGFSRCADGDRDLGPRGQFPIDPGLQPRGTEPRAFGTRPWPRQPLGRFPDVMVSQSEDTEVAIPEAFEPSQPLRSAASVPPSHSRERPEIVWALFLPRTTRVRILLNGPIPKTSDSARDEMSLRRQIRIAEPVSEHRERYPCGSKHQRQLLVILTAETCCQRERHWTWRIY